MMVLITTIVTLALTVLMTRTVTTVTIAMTTTAAPMAIAEFSLQEKLGMVRFFQETFWVVLEILFLTLGSASLWFAEGELV